MNPARQEEAVPDGRDGGSREHLRPVTVMMDCGGVALTAAGGGAES